MMAKRGKQLQHICYTKSFKNNCCLRTFVNAWHSSMKIHDVMAENRIRFAQRLNEMSEELSTLAKEVDKNRKQVYYCI